MNSLNVLADQFLHAFYHQEWSGNENPEFSNYSITESYQVQELFAQKRLAIGEIIAGFKVGCTSKAIRTQFGLNEPISARLFHPHIFEEGVKLDWSDYINCAIEPEMVIKTGTDLRGHDLSDEVLIDGIESISPGIEIHNFHFWQSAPSAQELICSGGIHAGLVVGNTRVSPGELNFKDEIFSVYKNSQLVTSAPASEIMGGPLHALRWLVNSLTDQGSRLRKGSLVIPGSPVELVTIDQDTDLTIEIDNVGSLTTKFESA